MNKIPTQLENPNGLHQRYVIRKLVHEQHPLTYVGGEPSLVREGIYEREPDKDAEYFVMRLDEGGKDPEHIKACRIGVNAYADAIAHHLPELAKDLKERYPI